MPDPSQLPHLLRLLDDETPQVRETVRRELAAYGPSLRQMIRGLDVVVTPSAWQLIDEFLAHFRRERLRQSWSSWLDRGHDKDRLEAAMGLISEFLDERSTPDILTGLLDGLAGEFGKRRARVDARGLATFLFRVKRLEGARSNFYHLQNSNLVYVIERGQGIPISLTCVYLLVGHRLGISLEGCNFPGHFLALATVGDRREVIDCFNGGITLGDADLFALDAPPSLGIDDIARLACDSSGIVARVLRNLINSYRLCQDRSEPGLTEPNVRLNIQLMKELLGTLDLAPGS